MQDNDYIVLLHKHLSGEISPTEQASLDAWLQSSADNTRLADDLRLAWEQTGGYEKTFDTDLDTAFGKVQARIRAEEQPMRATFVRGQLLRIAAAIVLLIAGVWGFRHFYYNASPTQMVVSSATGTKEVTLPDGTQVWLRQGAEVAYPTAFAGNTRPVQLKGEAYFKVAHDASKPFRVQLEDGKGSVEVLGTQFNVRQNTDETAVTVREGKVRFAPDAQSNSVILTAGKKAVLNKARRQIVTENVLTFNELSWQSGGLEFVSTPLRQVVRDLQTYYNAQITLSNSRMLDCTYTAPLTRQSLEKVLESLSLTYQMQWEKTGANAYRLTGGSCQ
ncbi:MAG: FecR domain-containing protein [Saprospiraceae bacterium]|nr:FecR domain-containing protein [Saprospiraceae bacterium]